uniref:Virion structural protein n=1 Tax=Panagrellus redivivus TaxID=6233 RepID=A0A7E4V2D9_PANRE
MVPFSEICEIVYHIIYDGAAANYTCEIVPRNLCPANRASAVSFDDIKATFEKVLPFVSVIDVVLLDYTNCVNVFPQEVHNQLCDWLQSILDVSARIVVSPVHFALFRDIRQIDTIPDGEQLVAVNWKGKSTPLKDFVLLSKKDGVLKPLKFVERPELDSLNFNTLVVGFDVAVSQRGLQKIQKMFPGKTVLGVAHDSGPLSEAILREFFFNYEPDRTYIASHLGVSVLVKVGTRQFVLDKNFADEDDPQEYIILDAGVAFFEVWMKYLSYGDNQLFKMYEVTPVQKPRLLVLWIRVDKYLTPYVSYNVVDLVMPEKRLPTYIDPHLSHSYLYATTLMSIRAPVVNCILDNPYSVVHHAVYPTVDSLIKPYETNEDLIIDLMARTTPSVVKLTVQEYYDSSTLAVINERRETLKLAGYNNLMLVHSFAMTWTCILRSLPENIAIGETVAIINMMRTVVLKRCETDFEVVSYFWIVENVAVLPKSFPRICPDHVIWDNTHGEYDSIPHYAKKKNLWIAQKDVVKDYCSHFWSMAKGEIYDGFFIRNFADLTFYVMATNGLSQSFETNLVSLPFAFEFDVKFRMVDEVQIRVGNNINHQNERFLIKKIKVKQHPLAIAASLNLRIDILGPCEFKVEVKSTTLLFKEDDLKTLSEEDAFNADVVDLDDLALLPEPQITIPEAPTPMQIPVDPKMMMLYSEFQRQSHLVFDSRHSDQWHIVRNQVIRMASDTPMRHGSSTDVFLSWTMQNTIEIHKVRSDYKGKTFYPAFVSFKDGIHFGDRALQDFQTNMKYVIFDIYKLVSDDCHTAPNWPFTVEFIKFGDVFRVNKVITQSKHETDPWTLFELVMTHVVEYVKKNSASEIKTVVIQLPKQSSLVHSRLAVLGKNLRLNLCMLA